MRIQECIYLEGVFRVNHLNLKDKVFTDAKQIHLRLNSYRHDEMTFWPTISSVGWVVKIIASRFDLNSSY